MLVKMRYRLALDLGTNSLGWAMIRLNPRDEPIAVIRAGVRIFSDGRNPKDGSSLAVTRRLARSMRRRRDRLLKRKYRLIDMLVKHGFFPAGIEQRRTLEQLDPYSLRAKGLDKPLSANEFGRAIFHLNQRRGFKSNRKTDKQDSESGSLKAAIAKVREALAAQEARTIGELLHKRKVAGLPVRARFRQTKMLKDDGKSRIEKSYDLYIERKMVEDEFDQIWVVQAAANPALYNETARRELRDTLLFQRPLRPVKPGRCTLIPEEERAPLALPSTQRFRIYQEVNNLRVIDQALQERPLTMEQRNAVVEALEFFPKRTFAQIRRLLNLSSTDRFNLEDGKRDGLKGNETSAQLAKPDRFGESWFSFTHSQQDEIVLKLVQEESDAVLIPWLQEHCRVDFSSAFRLSETRLPEGYGSLSAKALTRILAELRNAVITYDKAVLAAGFDHHSNLGAAATGEIHALLPYYGQALQRHVGFGTGSPQDPPEKQYGKIANPTVHIGLNQLRLVVNALIKRYGHPSEVIIEVARELKQSKDQRDEENRKQAEHQRRNARIRTDIATTLSLPETSVSAADIQKVILWEELSHDPLERRCPYSGKVISFSMLLSDQVEIEHILPFSQTLDDSLNNKTVALREANRIKGNQSPWEAFGKRTVEGYEVQSILDRAKRMPRAKAYRFGEDGLQKWLREDKDFLARALNDTRYLSRVAREYLSLICPQNTRVIPGRMTALLRGKFGLNSLLSASNTKNRDDHRHHAIDACVIGITDQGLLQRFAQASARAREHHLNRLVADMPLPWPSYREHVERAVRAILVSHKPDHSHEGAMHNDTAYGLMGGGLVRYRKVTESGKELITEPLKVIEMRSEKAAHRHGLSQDGSPKAYKGYKGDSNYCLEIYLNDKGKWVSQTISTFDAYQAVRQHGREILSKKDIGLCGKPLVMRLMINDMVRFDHDNHWAIMRVATIKTSGQILLAPHDVANADKRNRDQQDSFGYTSKTAGSLQTARAQKVSISPIGGLCNQSFA